MNQPSPQNDPHSFESHASGSAEPPRTASPGGISSGETSRGETSTSDVSTGGVPTPASTRLLTDVLRETLLRRNTDPDGLLASMRTLVPQHAEAEVGPDLFVVIVTHVLRHRLGIDAERLPQSMPAELADVLWSDPDARGRIGRLWQTVVGQT